MNETFHRNSCDTYRQLLVVALAGRDFSVAAHEGEALVGAVVPEHNAWPCSQLTKLLQSNAENRVGERLPTTPLSFDGIVFLT